MRVHLVYPYGERRVAPWSIGNHLTAALQDAGHTVINYDWEDRVRMEVIPGEDILLGHPHQDPGYCFETNLWQPFMKRYAISPNNGSPEYVGRVMQHRQLLDGWFAICGPYWAKRLEWGTPVDMAIDCEHWPFIKRAFNPPGERRVLYVGCAVDYKGTDFLSAIAASMPDVYFGHVGPGLIPGTNPWGYVPLETPQGAELAAGYDFLIAPGKADANPTTILEAMAWGLIPICTYQSGWGECAAFNYGDVATAVATIRNMQQWPDQHMRQVQADNMALLERDYTWNNFTSRVLGVIGGNKDGQHQRCSL